MKKFTFLFYLLIPLISTGQIFEENFEGPLEDNDLPAGFSETGLSDDGIWAVGNAEEASDGLMVFGEHTNFAYTNDDECNCDKSEDRLILETLDFSNLSTVQLTYSAFKEPHTGNFADNLYVEISLDGGSTWTLLDEVNQQVG